MIHAADGNDWINPAFVLEKSGAPNAQQKIIQYAKSSGSQGPWSELKFLNFT